MKIGILGGSFDPIHNGHLHMAKCAHDELDLDRVILMPAGHSPNKDESAMSEAAHRLSMCELAAKDYDWLSVSSLEIDSQEKSYTYRTLEKLKKLYPSDKLFFIMGADSFDYFDCWVHPEIIAELSTIVVIPRKNFSADSLNKKISQISKDFLCDVRILNCEMYTISSTELRNDIRSGREVESFLSPQVLDYILKKRLYHGFD
jgi:nicotinate-nucleotide adenylyltransferase